jgi:hypothetical protein
VAELKGITEFIAGGGLLGFIAFACWAYQRGWWCTGRELAAMQERAVRAEDREKKWETLALDGLRVARKATSIAQVAQYSPAVQPPPDGMSSDGRLRVQT